MEAAKLHLEGQSTLTSCSPIWLNNFSSGGYGCCFYSAEALQLSQMSQPINTLLPARDAKGHFVGLWPTGGEWGKTAAHTWWQWGTPHHVSSWSPWQARCSGSQGSPSCLCPGERPFLYSNTKHLFQCSKHMLFCMPWYFPPRDSCCPPDPDLPLDYSYKKHIFLIPVMKFLSSPSNCWKPFTSSW